MSPSQLVSSGVAWLWRQSWRPLGERASGTDSEARGAQSGCSQTDSGNFSPPLLSLLLETNSSGSQTHTTAKPCPVGRQMSCALVGSAQERSSLISAERPGRWLKFILKLRSTGKAKKVATNYYC